MLDSSEAISNRETAIERGNSMKILMVLTYDRACHSVFRIRGRHCPGGHRRTDRPGSRGYDAAYRIGRCRRRRGRCGPCGAVEQHDRAGWSRTDPSRRAGSAIPEYNRGLTDGNHRSQSPVFRRGNQRPKSHAGRKSSPGAHTLQRMARALCEITSAHRYAPREVVSDPKATLLRSGNKRPLTHAGGRRPHRRDSFRRLAEHLGPKVKPKNQHLGPPHNV